MFGHISFATLVSCCINVATSVCESSLLPVVVATWPYPTATKVAWNHLQRDENAVDAIVAGCSHCEVAQCRGGVGYGANPDEEGNVTLDAMIIDGKTMNIGAVGCLTNTKSAIAVARAVMRYTQHTLLVGEKALRFAEKMGFGWDSTLSSELSDDDCTQWKQNSCQPNFWQNVTPDPEHHCGPYTPIQTSSSRAVNDVGDIDDHDTIGMLAIDKNGDISSGTSTNGLNHKIPGRLGDSPVPGAGSYAMNGVGAANSTGNGDVMMRFLPSFHAVMMMKEGMDPLSALKTAMQPIKQFYPSFKGAMIAVNNAGDYAAVCHGFKTFDFCVANPSFQDVQILTIQCE